MSLIKTIVDNIYLVITGNLLLIAVFYFIFNRIKPKPDPVLEAFFLKYNIDLDNNAETELKLKEIANINSSYPDEDKAIAQALIRFKNQLNSNNN